jgi:ketosteroid isomerase-like protein
MRKLLSALLIICAFAASYPAQKSDRNADLRSLVEAERGFARASVEKGTRAAFIENLADDSILFRPRPVNGKKWMEERKATPGVLTWQPVFADVSGAGDMGYTTGPWEYREKSLQDQPAAHGQFVSIWKRQANRTWKVAVDIGTTNPRPEQPAPEDVTFPAGARHQKKQKKIGADVEAERATLLRMEEDFSKSSAAKTTVDAFLSYIADDVRLFRTSAFPAVGREAARVMLAKKSGLLAWKPATAEVSQSGDLGYSYGSYEFKAADGKATESGNYLRIWKKQQDGRWKVVLDLLNPLPPAPAS